MKITALLLSPQPAGRHCRPRRGAAAVPVAHHMCCVALRGWLSLTHRLAVSWELIICLCHMAQRQELLALDAAHNADCCRDWCTETAQEMHSAYMFQSAAGLVSCRLCALCSHDGVMRCVPEDIALTVPMMHSCRGFASLVGG